MRVSPTVVAFAVLTGTLVSVPSGVAGQASPPTPPAAATPPAPAPAPNPRAGLSVVMEGTDLLVQRRRFDAGNRTYWHTHERGFLILVEKGTARVQKQGEPMKELKAGGVDYTPPNVLHWHGAGPGEEFVQVGVSFGGGITFTDPVTDAQYSGK